MKYTAQEMREAADNFWVGGVICEVKDKDGRVVKHIKHDAVIAMLRQAADIMEREKREMRRKKKYEYSVKYISGCGLHCKLSCNTLDEAYSFVRNSIASRKRIYRREIGEWEEIE